MTSYEAEQQVKNCESHIEGTYGALINAAWAVGTSAFQAAANKVIIMTVAPLCVALVGFILNGIAGSSASIVGAFMVIGGFIAAWKMHKSAAEVRRAVQNQQNNLNTTINNNLKI